jgi:predicted nucleotidyltransferase
MLKDAFDHLTQRIAATAQQVYGDRLVSVVLYGSVARGTMRHDSDVDLLIVARDLPAGRLNRVKEFEAVEDAVGEELSRAASRGIHTSVSPVVKTPEEVTAGSPLFLDMVEDARVLYDRQGFFAQRLARLRNRLSELGAKRVWKGNAWYWDLKPDYRPGEVFEL